MLNPCLYCQWQDDCEDMNTYLKEYCDDYLPVDDMAEENYLNAIIEDNRASFRGEWFSYVEYYNS